MHSACWRGKKTCWMFVCAFLSPVTVSSLEMRRCNMWRYHDVFTDREEEMVKVRNLIALHPVFFCLQLVRAKLDVSREQKHKKTERRSHCGRLKSEERMRVRGVWMSASAPEIRWTSVCKAAERWAGVTVSRSPRLGLRIRARAFQLRSASSHGKGSDCTVHLAWQLRNIQGQLGKASSLAATQPDKGNHVRREEHTEQWWQC